MPNDKKTILIFTRGYAPGYRYGGAMRSILNMVSALRKDYAFKIVAADRDLGASDNAPYPDIIPDIWQNHKGVDILYLSPKQRSLKHIKQIIKTAPHDILYLNSFFDFHFTILPLLSRKKAVTTILAPRGELFSSALAIKKVKKRLFITGAKLCKLYKDIVWLASTAEEKEAIESVMAVEATNIHVVQDITTISELPPLRADRQDGDALRILFLSRIVPIKNLEFALQVLSATTVPVNFTIAGPPEDKPYWEKCRHIIERLPENIVVQIMGEVPLSSVPQIMAQHDLLFLPSKGESFGHVIAEALAVGTRVIISDRTPWHNVSQYNAGYALPLNNPDGFVEAITAEYSSHHYNHHTCLQLCRNYLEHINSNGDDIIAAHHALFSC